MHFFVVLDFGNKKKLGPLRNVCTSKSQKVSVQSSRLAGKKVVFICAQTVCICVSVLSSDQQSVRHLFSFVPSFYLIFTNSLTVHSPFFAHFFLIYRNFCSLQLLIAAICTGPCALSLRSLSISLEKKTQWFLLLFQLTDCFWNSKKMKVLLYL